MNKLVLLAFCSIFGAGCAAEKQVDITLLTSTRDSTIVVDDTYIEMTEGEAIGIQVEALENDESQPQWSVRADSANRSVAEIAKTEDEGVFVVIARRPGTTHLRFELRGRDTVEVPVMIRERDESEFSSAGGAQAERN